MELTYGVPQDLRRNGCGANSIESSSEFAFALGTVARRLRNWLGGKNEGSAIIEFAYVLPFMLILITGLFSFGIFLSQYLCLINAVDIGARALSVSRGIGGSTPCSGAVTTVKNAAPNLPLTTSQFTFYLNGTSYSASQCDSQTLSTGENATLSVSYPFTITMYGWSPVKMNVSATTTEVVQ
jgi:Flp pilus assembly protein TadG